MNYHADTHGKEFVAEHDIGSSDGKKTRPQRVDGAPHCGHVAGWGKDAPPCEGEKKLK